MSRHAGVDTLKLVENAFNACLRPTQIKLLLEMMKGQHMDTKTIQDYQRKWRNAGIFEDDTVDELQKELRKNPNSNPEEIVGPKGKIHKPTAADRLLANLRNRPDASFTALYAKYDSKLLKVYKQTKLKMRKSSIEEIDAASIEDPNDPEKVAKYVKKVRDALSVSGTTNILLGIA